jgi:hypothetical protein
LKNKKESEENGAIVLIAATTEEFNMITCQEIENNQQKEVKVNKVEAARTIASVIEAKEYDTMSKVKEPTMLSWADMCESSDEESDTDENETEPPDLMSCGSESSIDEWDDDDKDIPNLLNRGSESSTDDWEDDFENDDGPLDNYIIEVDDFGN